MTDQPSAPNGKVDLSKLDLPSGQQGPITIIGGGPTPQEAQKFAQLNIRYGQSPAEQQASKWRIDNGWDHARPNSVLLASIGSHWRPRCWQRVMDMMHFANSNGLYVGLTEIQDRCYQPYDALGTMRNEAILKAQEGWEYLCMVDTDILPQPEALVRLVKRLNDEERAIIVPFIDEPGTQKPLHGPNREKFSGLKVIRWTVLSMMVFRTAVFRPFNGQFWDNAIGSDEGYHFQKLASYGHYPMIDTDVIVPTQSAPTYPLTTMRLTPDEFTQFWQKKKEWLLLPPDRRPVNPDDPRVRDGMYLPFFKPPCPKCQAEMTEIVLPDGVAYQCGKCPKVEPAKETAVVTGQ